IYPRLYCNIHIILFWDRPSLISRCSNFTFCFCEKAKTEKLSREYKKRYRRAFILFIFQQIKSIALSKKFIFSFTVILLIVVLKTNHQNIFLISRLIFLL